MIVVAIEGTSGSGKSSVAKCLSERLSFRLLSTGLLYREITRACPAKRILPEEIDKVVAEAKAVSIADILPEAVRQMLAAMGFPSPR